MEKPNIPDALLQKGTEIEITVANPGLLHKLGFKRSVYQYTIRPLYTGALLEICRLLDQIDFKDLEKINLEGNTPFSDVLRIMVKNIVSHSEKLNEILAWGIFNRPRVTFLAKRKYRKLVKIIRDNLDNAERVRFLNVIIQHMGTQDFLAFMVSIRGMNPMETGSTSGKSLEDSTTTSD
jgi:hypothetical protein